MLMRNTSGDFCCSSVTTSRLYENRFAIRNRIIWIVQSESQFPRMNGRYGNCSYDKFFGRTEVMHVLGITASPASELIKNMLDLGIVYPMKGKGKGKYLFKRK